jgi:O-antigen ligase
MVDHSLLAEARTAFKETPTRAIGVAALSLLGFAIPIDPAPVALATIIVFVIWLIRGGFRTFPQLAVHNPVVRAALILFGLFILGMFYAPIYFGGAFSVLMKYRELLLIPILMVLAETERERRVALWGFMAAVLLSLVISYLEAFGLMHIGPGHEPTAFQHHIIYGTFLAYFLFFAAHLAADSRGVKRWLLVGIVLIGTVNLFYLTASRTGYVLYLVLAGLFIWRRLTWKGVIIAAIVMIAGFTVLWETSWVFSRRVDRVVTSLLTHEWGERKSPTDQRIEQWRRGIKIIAEAPILGHGTGSYASTIRPNDRDNYRRVGGQPHDEYILITIQLGVVGLAAYLWLLFVQWRTSRRLTAPTGHLAEGMVVMFAVGCLFNSSLLNSPEGHFFAFFSALFFAVPAPPSGRNPVRPSDARPTTARS